MFRSIIYVNLSAWINMFKSMTDTATCNLLDHMENSVEII